MDDFDLEPKNVDMEVIGQWVQEEKIAEEEETKGEEEEPHVQVNNHEWYGWWWCWMFSLGFLLFVLSFILAFIILLDENYALK
jgi:hypothetical protein